MTIWKQEFDIKLGSKPWTEMTDQNIKSSNTVSKQLSSWSRQSKIEGIATKTSPTIAAFNAKLYAVWIGQDSHDIYWASFDGNTWSRQSKIEGIATKTSPTIAAFNDKLYAAWIGQDSSDIYWAFFNS